MKRILIVLSIVLLAAIATRWVIKDNFHPVIEGQIYRSAQLSAGKLEKVVRAHDIQTVISLRRPRPNKSWYTDEKAAAEKLGIAHHDIDMDLTFSPRIDQLRDLRDLLQDAPRPLLVHCRAGADRTGLAAVMTKLLDGHSSMEEARAQVSWKFHAVRDNSMGIPFFNAYSDWLQSNELPHSSEHFNQWLDSDYVDLSGNVHFLVDQIRGQLWERPWGLINEGHRFEVKRADDETLNLSGWAFDTRNKSLLEGVEVSLGGVKFEENWYGIYQPWLLKDFHTEAYLDSGWMASQSLTAFEDGCHDLKLTFTRTDGSQWTSPPAARICIR